MARFSVPGISLKNYTRSAAAFVVLVLLGVSTFGLAANPSNPGNLPADVVRANQEIDQKFLEAHVHPNTDLMMSLFTSSPDIFFVGPTGIIFHGRNEVRESIDKFIQNVITMPGVIDYVTYLPAGDGVIAYGQVTYHRYLKGKQPDTRVVVWTDYRRKENGKWVLVFRHTHWPLGSNSLAGSETIRKPPSTQTSH